MTCIETFYTTVLRDTGIGILKNEEVPSLKIDINLPWTCKKLHCKGEPYRLSSKRDPSVYTDKQPITLILRYTYS